MPTISFGRDRLFTALGESYTQEEFEDLCFRFGIELDDVTTEKAIIRKEKHIDDEEADDDEEIIYKIEIPANRYDLLCLEGLAQALRVFNKKQEIPTYSLSDISKDKILKMKVKPETSKIRPFVVCAVLRGVTFDDTHYKSFIDLQDKLHQNICRRRSLVAIGTHDLDTLQGPFTYEALSPTDINFVPLKQTKSFRADELIEFYKKETMDLVSDSSSLNSSQEKSPIQAPEVADQTMDLDNTVEEFRQELGSNHSTVLDPNHCTAHTDEVQSFSLNSPTQIKTQEGPTSQYHSSTSPLVTHLNKVPPSIPTHVDLIMPAPSVSLGISALPKESSTHLDDTTNQSFPLVDQTKFDFPPASDCALKPDHEPPLTTLPSSDDSKIHLQLATHSADEGDGTRGKRQDKTHLQASLRCTRVKHLFKPKGIVEKRKKKANNDRVPSDEEVQQCLLQMQSDMDNTLHFQALDAYKVLRNIESETREAEMT